MRDIKYIVVHCTATPQNTTIQSIKQYWKKVLGWKSVGYHIIIDKNGIATRLADDSQITNGVKGYNSVSLHVSYIGGVDAAQKPIDNRTEAQKITLKNILCNWKGQYPNAIIQGHRDFPKVNKACPSFDAKKEYAKL